MTALASPPTAVLRYRRQRTLRTTRKVGLGIAGILGFLLTWQLASTTGILNPEQVPSATTTFTELARQLGDLEFWRNIGRTMLTWAIGLTIAVIAGTVLGGVVGLIPFLRRSTHTLVEFLRPIPSVALIPLASLMFGFQMSAGLLLIVYASFWQIFVQVLYGVADIDTVARDTARSFGLTRASRLRSLVLPTALPYLMTGLRLSAAVALILAITAEMTIGVPGLGRQLAVAAGIGNFSTVYAIVIVAGVLGLMINLVFRAFERKTLAWHQSVRGEEVL